MREFCSRDRTTDRLYLRLRRDWALIAEAEAEVLAALEDDLAAKAHETGAARLLEYLQGTLSNLLLISPPQDTFVEDFELALARLYREHIHARVHQFVTHLPRYSLAAAAGKFLENQEVHAEGWEEAPPNLRIAPEMFVAHVVGRSMEPRIPDGSLCIFRAESPARARDTGAGRKSRQCSGQLHNQALYQCQAATSGRDLDPRRNSTGTAQPRIRRVDPQP